MGGERPILENFRSIPQGLLSDRFFKRLIILEAQEHVEMLAKTIEINQNAHCLIPHSFSASLETKNTSIPLQPCPDDVDRKIGYEGWGVRAKCSFQLQILSTKIDWIATLLRIPANQECAYFLPILTWRFGGKFAYEGCGVRATCSIEWHISSAKSNWNTSKNITAQNPSPHFQNPWTPRMRLFLSIHKLMITGGKIWIWGLYGRRKQIESKWNGSLKWIDPSNENLEIHPRCSPPSPNFLHPVVSPVLKNPRLQQLMMRASQTSWSLPSSTGFSYTPGLLQLPGIRTHHLYLTLNSKKTHPPFVSIDSSAPKRLSEISGTCHLLPIAMQLPEMQSQRTWQPPCRRTTSQFLWNCCFEI